MKIHGASLRLAGFLVLVLAQACPSAPARDSGAGERILSISVLGNYKIDKGIVIKAFSLGIGDLYDYEAAKRGISSIESLHGVLGARLEEIRNRGEDGVRLLIVVTEKRAWTVKPLMRRSMTDRTSFGIGYSQMNFRGKNEQLHLSAMARGVTVLEASWLRPPQPFGGRFGTGVESFYTDYIYPFPDYRDLIGDDRIRWFGASLSIRVRLPYQSLLIFSCGAEYIDVWEPGHFLPSLPVSPYGLYAVIKTTLKHSRLEGGFYPMNGVSIAASRTEWGIAGSSKLNASVHSLSGTIFAENRWNTILRLHLSARSASSGAPYYLIGHLGGGSTLRGYDFGIFSGENTLLGRAELLIPLNFDRPSDLGNPMILTDLHLFLDSGAAWNNEDALIRDDFHSGFGFGVSFIPMRSTIFKLDAAWTLESSAVFYFDISTGFKE